jgi:hypothetical protein
LTLYFGSTRPGAPGGLYLATREAVGEPFANPTPLLEINNVEYDEWFPSISSDGLVLYFRSDRPGGKGEYDVWVATRDRKVDDDGNRMPFANIRNLSEINTPYDESGHTISSNGLTFFWSYYPTYKPGGEGSGEIWMTTRPSANDPFGLAINLGPPVNTAMLETFPAVSFDWPAFGSTLYFNRCRVQDCENNSDIYQATWHPDCSGNGDDDLEDIRDGTSQDANDNGTPDECEAPPAPIFRRADANADGKVDQTDAITTLTVLFLGGADIPCQDAADSNDDGGIDVSDAVFTLIFMFRGGVDIPPPSGANCGSDPTEDKDRGDLGCEAYPEAKCL